MSRLSKTQKRALRAIERVQAADDVAHDLNGDLSATSRNWPATAASLERRGLIDSEFDWTGPPEEGWSYTLTEAGRETVAALGRERGTDA